ncbi:hypothetical protein P691DRAFT_775032 [Macrolepiota fuliginosa MF-IS2]|uniref:Uncharacterized protein n=1 Tax=Macrolepiota fuliginosa MF-IS2 TaxID=1400762 RepID=A0A9P6C1X2_9AGAR|nr:hypothetical protein P691DRAFT_775032 [Macrolepiota fuliginosa MF-IS2]
MNSLSKFIPRPLAAANYPTLNLYKTAFRDPSRPGSIRTLGWEKPSVRIANTVTWLLHNAKTQGLAPREDGYVRVQDLLQHPAIANLDFPTIERAVKRFRSHQLNLTYGPHNTLLRGASTSQLSYWWIGLQLGTRQEYAPRRITEPDDIWHLFYQTPTADWPDIHQRGLSRGASSDITFSTQNKLPLHYDGDYTFIRLNPHRLIAESDIPLYHSRTITPKRGNKITETITTPTPHIPPVKFQSAVRVTVQRFPLVLRKPASKRRAKEGEEAHETLGKAVVMQAGVDALRMFGYANVVQGLDLDKVSTTQEEQLKSGKEKKVAGTAPNMRPTRRRNKDPPPHGTFTTI